MNDILLLLIIIIILFKEENVFIVILFIFLAITIKVNNIKNKLYKMDWVNKIGKVNNKFKFQLFGKAV
jgi:hypothetical protein